MASKESNKVENDNYDSLIHGVIWGAVVSWSIVAILAWLIFG